MHMALLRSNTSKVFGLFYLSVYRFSFITIKIIKYISSYLILYIIMYKLHRCFSFLHYLLLRVLRNTTHALVLNNIYACAQQSYDVQLSVVQAGPSRTQLLVSYNDPMNKYYKVNTDGGATNLTDLFTLVTSLATYLLLCYYGGGGGCSYTITYRLSTIILLSYFK